MGGRVGGIHTRMLHTIGLPLTSHIDAQEHSHYTCPALSALIKGVFNYLPEVIYSIQYFSFQNIVGSFQ